VPRSRDKGRGHAGAPLRLAGAARFRESELGRVILGRVGQDLFRPANGIEALAAKGDGHELVDLRLKRGDNILEREAGDW
jgi:hypothetical protein